MEPEGSIPNSQKLSTCPYVSQTNPVHITPSHLYKIQPPKICLPGGLLPSGFPTNNPKVQCRIRKSSPPVPILSQTNPVHITSSHLYKIHPNIIHPPTSWSSWRPPSLWLSHQQPEGSIPNSQELSTCPNPEPDQSSSHHPITPLQDP
jgi:hypothetical protein